MAEEEVGLEDRDVSVAPVGAQVRGDVRPRGDGVPEAREAGPAAKRGARAVDLGVDVQGVEDDEVRVARGVADEPALLAERGLEAVQNESRARAHARRQLREERRVEDVGVDLLADHGVGAHGQRRRARLDVRPVLVAAGPRPQAELLPEELVDGHRLVDFLEFAPAEHGKIAERPGEGGVGLQRVVVVNADGTRIHEAPAADELLFVGDRLVFEHQPGDLAAAAQREIVQHYAVWNGLEGSHVQF